MTSKEKSIEKKVDEIIKKEHKQTKIDKIVEKAKKEQKESR